jgi:hypothetical protein
MEGYYAKQQSLKHWLHAEAGSLFMQLSCHQQLHSSSNWIQTPVGNFCESILIHMPYLATYVSRRAKFNKHIKEPKYTQCLIPQSS